MARRRSPGSPLRPRLLAEMHPQPDGDPRPGSSLTAESSAAAHSTATHKHKSPMRRLMHGLKRLNSYSSDRSDSSSSGDDEDHNRSGDDQGGDEGFVERPQVQEIRFNYESLCSRTPFFSKFDPHLRCTSSKAVLPDPRQVPPQIWRTLPSCWFPA